MTSGIRTIMYPVKDIAAAKLLYSRLLAVGPYMDEAYHVGFNVEGQDVALHPNGHRKGTTGPSGSGKSTLMHCVAGLDSVTSGPVLWYASRGRHRRLSRRALGPGTGQGVA